MLICVCYISVHYFFVFREWKTFITKLETMFSLFSFFCFYFIFSSSFGCARLTEQRKSNLQTKTTHMHSKLKFPNSVYRCFNIFFTSHLFIYEFDSSVWFCFVCFLLYDIITDKRTYAEFHAVNEKSKFYFEFICDEVLQ